MKKIFNFLYKKRGKQKEPLIKEDPIILLEKAYNKLGIYLINNDTQIEAKTFYARVLCEMGVKQGTFTKVGEDIYQLNKKDEENIN